MSRLLLCVLAGCVVGVLSARVQHKALNRATSSKLVATDDYNEPDKSATDECSKVVEGATRRNSAWRRSLECKCVRGYSLVGSDSACGDGSKRYFKSDKLNSKGCKCMKNKECLPVDTQPQFNLTRFISKPWFIQQQMPTQYLPVEKNYCVSARYELLSKPSLWGYTIQVYNQASDKDGNVMDSGTFLCAYAYDEEDPAKLAVAPCFLPKASSGNYWVVAYDEEEGYAMVSGGQPFLETPLGCRLGSGTNDAGLWIFSRDPNPPEGLVQKVRDIASSKGFDVSVLNDVDHHKNCKGPNYSA